jgi:transcriptional antiterminator
MAATLDTLQIVKRLKEAGFAEPQAEAVTTVLRDAREADLSQLATKTDLEFHRQATKADLDTLRHELKSDADALRHELKSELDAHRQATNADFAAVRAELRELEQRLTIRLGSMIVVATGVLLAAKFFG